MVELEDVSLFRGLTPQELASLREIAVKRQFSGGSPVFREGDAGDGVYLIRSGTVQIAHLVGGEVRNIYTTLRPGDMFGEMAVIEDCPRSATALAAPEAELYFLPREEMSQLLRHTPVLAFNLLIMVNQRLRDFNQRHLRELVQIESLALIGRFAQGIVHDLKNPLSIIALSSELFDMPHINPDIRARTQSRIRKQVERIGNMVSDILLYTENKRRDIPSEPVRYDVFLNELLPDLQAEAEVKSVRIEVATPLPAVLMRLDPRRLNRVFFNIIHNATDEMPDGGTIFLRCRPEGAEMVTELEDTGRGISPEIAHSLFHAFASHGKEHGTGLGLSICKRIVEDHGGRIWAKNEPGRGAIFCIALPLAK